MSQTAFDTLSYFEKLTAAGMSQSLAKVQVEVMQSVVESHDKASRKDLATKGDIQDVRGEIQAVHNEIHDVRNELKDTRHEILKWLVTCLLTQSALFVGILAFLK